MGLESATFVTGLVATNPIGASDPKSQGDDHLRLIKSVLLNTFPNLNAAVNSTPAELNLLHGLPNLFAPGFAYKATNTDRNSLTLLTDDPDLSVALAAGTHLYECHLNFQCLSSTTQGIKCAMVFTGTADIHNGSFEGEPANAAFFLFIDSGSAIPISGWGGVPNVINVNQIIKVRMLIRVTVAGTLKLQWAQNTNSANATRVDKGSYLRTQRMV